MSGSGPEVFRFSPPQAGTYTFEAELEDGDDPDKSVILFVRSSCGFSDISAELACHYDGHRSQLSLDMEAGRTVFVFVAGCIQPCGLSDGPPSYALRVSRAGEGEPAVGCDAPPDPPGPLGDCGDPPTLTRGDIDVEGVVVGLVSGAPLGAADRAAVTLMSRPLNCAQATHGVAYLCDGGQLAIRDAGVTCGTRLIVDDMDCDGTDVWIATATQVHSLSTNAANATSRAGVVARALSAANMAARKPTLGRRAPGVPEDAGGEPLHPVVWHGHARADRGPRGPLRAGGAGHRGARAGPRRHVGAALDLRRRGDRGALRDGLGASSASACSSSTAAGGCRGSSTRSPPPATPASPAGPGSAPSCRCAPRPRPCCRTPRRLKTSRPRRTSCPCPTSRRPTTSHPPPTSGPPRTWPPCRTS